MASFGSALRRTRLGWGISLDDVARDTCLTKRCLKTFEDESIPELPGEPYNRAYLRSYSAYLGLDPDDQVSDYEREAEAQNTFHVGTRVIFWTFVTGGGPGETIRHVWTHEGRTAGAVDLTVAGPSWRTQSRRTLVPGTEGEWVVEALDSERRVLARQEFRCEVLSRRFGSSPGLRWSR